MTYMTPAQITTNVITPGVEVAVTVAYPNLASAANATATPSVLDGDA